MLRDDWITETKILYYLNISYKGSPSKHTWNKPNTTAFLEHNKPGNIVGKIISPQYCKLDYLSLSKNIALYL